MKQHAIKIISLCEGIESAEKPAPVRWKMAAEFKVSKPHDIAYHIVKSIVKGSATVESITDFLEKKFRRDREYSVEDVVENVQEIVEKTIACTSRVLVEFGFRDLDKAKEYQETHNCGKVWLNQASKKWNVYEYK